MIVSRRRNGFLCLRKGKQPISTESSMSHLHGTPRSMKMAMTNPVIPNLIRPDVSGQVGRCDWIPAFAGMTKSVYFHSNDSVALFSGE